MGSVGRMKLGSLGLEVSAQGLRCMGMPAFYGPPKPEADVISLIHHAIRSGITLPDTSDIYGPFTNEILLGKLKKERSNILGYLNSEASASTIRTARAVHPLTAVQLEWSLWSRDVEEDIVPTCRELGIGIVAYSPLGRGFLSSGPKIVDSLWKKDFRKSLPIFKPQNLQHNASIFEHVPEMAMRKGCRHAALRSLRWLGFTTKATMCARYLALPRLKSSTKILEL